MSRPPGRGAPSRHHAKTVRVEVSCRCSRRRDLTRSRSTAPTPKAAHARETRSDLTRSRKHGELFLREISRQAAEARRGSCDLFFLALAPLREIRSAP